ncbi:hypothetical protein R1flu_004827 [Riccia fluitans]|uniref:Uncharacterized protein n=1 Tax=Riccia fluitans TaxID=41844 RepID=A0ABD1YRE4_9MARC
MPLFGGLILSIRSTIGRLRCCKSLLVKNVHSLFVSWVFESGVSFRVTPTTHVDFEFESVLLALPLAIVADRESVVVIGMAFLYRGEFFLMLSWPDITRRESRARHTSGGV